MNTGARLARAHVPSGHQADAAGDGCRCGQLLALASQLCMQLRELCKGHRLRARLFHPATLKLCPAHTGGRRKQAWWGSGACNK
jgi:hypothetical protein